MNQKARPIPLHPQEKVGKELEKLIKTGHRGKVKHVDVNFFVSPVVITMKNEKSIENALDSRKLNDRCIKIRPQMPNMDELSNKISVEITRDRTKINDFENRSRPRIPPDEIVKNNKPTMRTRNNRGKIQRIL